MVSTIEKRRYILQERLQETWVDVTLAEIHSKNHKNVYTYWGRENNFISKYMIPYFFFVMFDVTKQDVTYQVSTIWCSTSIEHNSKAETQYCYKYIYIYYTDIFRILR